MFDYMPGKADWLAYGLPVEPREAEERLVKTRMHREFPTCRPAEPLDEARKRAQAAGGAICPVVNEMGILLGLIGADDWNGDPQTPVGKVMEPGPTTVRPSLSIDEAKEMLAQGKQQSLLVTSSDGKLMGIFRR